MPEPNVSCGLSGGSRVMSNVAGSAKTVGSWLAWASDGAMNVPFGNLTPRYSMSSLAKRPVPRTVPDEPHRLLDGTRRQLGVARPAAATGPDVAANSEIEQPSWFRVVSVPAISTASHIMSSSS